MRDESKALLHPVQRLCARRGMTCGTSPRTRRTGADVYVLLMQAAALLPAVYMFILSGYPALAARRNVFAFLFEAGLSALPRAEVRLLACLYRGTARETFLHMAMLIAALLFGLIAGRLLHGYGPQAERNARLTRIAFAVLIAADLLVRLQPFVLQVHFGAAAAVIGFAVRAVCLLLVLADLSA